ncbi:hypothetical protein F8M41_009502 [Gigaspora margarita]|uniref:Uncharacterized protein n=1 Tax=Gigaspora margarita TaxID=4874 RepID=A0A8H4A3X6_GIGMA|nr:hypothetical protein F8M41_009502 [Gigaspora margarita]
MVGTKGRARQNNGPCAICECESTFELFRKLTEKSLKIANNSPYTDLIVDALKVGDELCQKRYNSLIAFEWGQIKSNKKKRKKKMIYHIIQILLNGLKFLNHNHINKLNQHDT